MDEKQWFEQLYVRYVDFLLRMGRRLLNPGESEDALYDMVQEIFLLLWDRRAELMHHPNIGGWLMEALKFRVRGTRNKVTRRSLRHAYSLDEEDVAPIADPGETPEQRAAFAHHIDEIRALLGEDDAALFIAHALEARSTHELAAERGVSNSCIAMRILRLKRRLAKHPEIFFALLLFALRLRRFAV